MGGALLALLFKQLFRRATDEMIKDLRKQIDEGKDILNFSSSFRHETISRGIRQGLATGNWGHDKQGDVQKTGVSQVLNRLTFASSLSHLRRLTTPLSK